MTSHRASQPNQPRRRNQTSSSSPKRKSRWRFPLLLDQPWWSCHFLVHLLLGHHQIHFPIAASKETLVLNYRQRCHLSLDCPAGLPGQRR